MYKNKSVKLNKVTVATIAAVFSITVLAITSIDYLFIDSVIINDAHSLSENIAKKIHSKLFTDRQTKTNGIKTRSVIPTVKSELGIFSNKMSIPSYTWKPLVGAPHLREFINESINRSDYLNSLQTYAVYTPAGNVFLPQQQLLSMSMINNFSHSYSIISKVQSVFIHGKSLYAYREHENHAYTQHFIPILKDGGVVAVVLLEASQSSAGLKMTDAVSNAIYFTIISGLPILLLLMYLMWKHFKEKHLAQEQISFMSFHDELTELPNRLAFNKLIEHTIENANSAEDTFAVFSLDLDNFNKINDALGHKAGDLFLINVVKRLEDNNPQRATLSRIAGDEFAIIMPGVSTSETASDIAKIFLEQIMEPFTDLDEDISCTVSIGIAFGPENGQDADTIIRNASMALYLAKKDGGNTFRFFDPDIDQALQKRRELEKSLSLALKREEFELYYQPQVELTNAKVMGYEALLRWNHPTKGMISPVDFIPILEETKMIIEVGEYVMRRACREALTWDNDAKVAVNISTVQFEHQDIPAMVARALADTGLPAERLEVEITESALMTDISAALVILHDLAELGVLIAMDDFGTGYSSLSYIAEFEFDKIKIDRSFISSIQHDEKARTIITTIIGLGRALDIMITAEGIETKEQLLLIQAAGCHFGQGYLFGRPVPLSELDLKDGSSSENSAPDSTNENNDEVIYLEDLRKAKVA